MDNGRDIRLWRREERDRLIAERRALGAEFRRRWSEAIERRLAALLGGLPARTIGFYSPHKGEFDPLPVAEAMIAQGRIAALPAITDRRGPLEYRAWQPGAEVERGAYGIPAPKAGALLRPDIVVVPLLGFDSANYRLGYGGGYFDRTIAALAPRPVTIGVGFEQGRIATIFPQDHDIALDFIVSETVLQPKLGQSGI
jgi:5-formyltetrahydrofolate cyclo-ligase